MNEFVQMCLNRLLSSDDVIKNIWDELNKQEKIHIISYVISIIELHDKGKDSWVSLPSSNSVSFLIDILKVIITEIFKIFLQILFTFFSG